MSDLRSKILRLAHEKPELREHLLPLLDGSVGKTANSFDAIEFILPMNDMAKLYHRVEKEDEQSAELLLSVYNTLRSRLKLVAGESEALGRLRELTMRGQKWDAALIRNNIFKAANALGMKLPSAMF